MGFRIIPASQFFIYPFFCLLLGEFDGLITIITCYYEW